MLFKFKISFNYLVLGLLFITFDAFGFTSSNLPIMVIETRNQNITRDSRVAVQMGLIYNGHGKRNSINDPVNHFNGKADIRLRGNSTQGFPKKPYDFTLINDKGEDLNFPLLGMASHEDWILLASYMDHTFIRTPLASHMSLLAGRWASSSRMVELVVDNQYQGIYILIEKIARSNRRLGVEKLEPDQITFPDITGGYIYEISGQKNNFGNTRYLRYPKFENAAPEQIDYIRKYDDQFRKAMSSPNYEREYPRWIEVETFVDELIVQEAMRNSDAYGWSSYFHKRRGEKISAGPVWDFDQSAGNSSYPDDGVVEGWLYSHSATNNRPFFWDLLMEDPIFKYKVKRRWQTLRQNEYKTENLLAYIDSIANLLSEAQQREFAKWPVLGANIWRETEGYRQRNTYQKEVDYLKQFLVARWDWMDKEIAKFEDQVSVINQQVVDQVSVYPNPFNTTATIEISSLQSSDAIIHIYSSLGNIVLAHTTKLVAGTNYFELNLNSLQNGIYIYHVQIDNTDRYRGKLIKSD